MLSNFVKISVTTMISLAQKKRIKTIISVNRRFSVLSVLYLVVIEKERCVLVNFNKGKTEHEECVT